LCGVDSLVTDLEGRLHRLSLSLQSRVIRDERALQSGLA